MKQSTLITLVAVGVGGFLLLRSGVLGSLGGSQPVAIRTETGAVPSLPTTYDDRSAGSTNTADVAIAGIGAAAEIGKSVFDYLTSDDL